MAATAVLRIEDVPLGEGRRRVAVSWQDGAVRQVTASVFAYQVGEAEAEKVRWYLEDYAEFPADPGPRLALEAESVLAGTGVDLFTRVFTGMDAAGIWGQVRPLLGRVRVEVDTDPGEAPGLPWELLRDPGTGAALALDAGTFVRTHLQASRAATLPAASGDRLRVLLVICRPGRGDDVPFRSVASRLARGGGAEMEGLDLDVLRPATFARLSQVLHQAADAGLPYHVVHFDGHGTYRDLADLQPDDDDEAEGPGSGAPRGGRGVGVSPLRYGISVAGPVRPGQHGYLIFEDPASPANQQFADGPALGRLLTATGVPVLVLNACRSAWTEASPHPGPPDEQPADPGVGTVPGEDGAGAGLADVHARIRAYGSLAAEVADAGVPGVVAMRYNVYVVTAAQYVADLYAHLLAGRSLGQAATASRRALAADPTRQITGEPVALQDWAVPVVYEAAPLTLIEPGTRDVPLIQLTAAGEGSGGDAGAVAAAVGGVPRPPDAGFFGRDETLLALDRAFDTQQTLLLQAFAGAGKSSTAAEFARWYQATGGLDHPDHPDWGPGEVLWSSFEHHLPLDRLVGAAGDRFAGLLEANGIHWQALADPGQRRDVLLQVLAQAPVLWVWDNVEPVTGFPPGMPSAWTRAEQDELAGFLRDVAQNTGCKVLLTSRRGEQAWLGGLPARLDLRPMPMRERLQLAAAIAARHGYPTLEGDWRPLLRFSGGNPLAITVLVGQALRDHLTTTEQIQDFVDRLRAGEQELEAEDDAALGRTRSLAASLSYGFTHAFTEAERGQLAVLHLFRDTADVDALRYMGDPDIAGDDAVPQLARLTRETTVALLDRAAEIGLLSPLGGGYYAIHPALPWYFTTLFASAHGLPGDPEAQRAARAYTHTLAQLGYYYWNQINTGAGDPVPAVSVEEANLQHALALARRAQHWADVMGCVQGLRTLYPRTGRDGEWARLVADITPDFIDPATDGPLPGREDQWSIFTQARVWLAREARDWPTATRLQQARAAWNRDRAVAALNAPDDQLNPAQRYQLRTLAVSLEDLGHILREQDDPGCLANYQEALELFQRIQDSYAECNLASSIGAAYLTVTRLRDLDQAEYWHQRSLDLEPEGNLVGRAKSIMSLATVAQVRLQDALAVGEPQAVLLDHLNAALRGYYQALDLFPADDAEDLADIHNQLGVCYALSGDTARALRHFQESIRYEEARGDIYSAGQGRYNIALLLVNGGRASDALMYARAALLDYERIGPGATQDAAQTRDLIDQIEQQVIGAT